MSQKYEGPDPYELLEVALEATEAEIRKAYRQQSLKVHPDRHPNNPDAAAKFHELNQAYELLLDPTKRSSLDLKIRSKLAHKERYAKFDAKRKEMQDELEEAEQRAAKRAKMERDEKRNREAEAERLRDEGRRMMEKKMADMKRKEEEERGKTMETQKVYEIGPLDTTVRVKYPLSKHPDLTTPSSLSTLLSPFGKVDEASIVLSMKPSKKAPNKPPKFATALIPFSNVQEAHASICASGLEGRGLKDIEVSWAGGKEPAILEALKRKPQEQGSTANVPSVDLSFTTNPHAQSTSTGPSTAPSFSFDPFEIPDPPNSSTSSGLDYESITLMRLRQAERERLEREIREQEAVNS